YCNYEDEERTENGSQTVQVSSEVIIHDDMRLAFRQLVPHLCLICEEIEDSDDLAVAMDSINSLNEESDLATKLQSYRVTAFKTSGSGDGEGVTITGQKKLKSGKVVNLNTPF